MEDIFQKFKKQFIGEIFGLLESVESDLLKLEKVPDDPQLIDSVFRAMHTIKGTSAMYGCTNISDFTHHLESIFQVIRDTVGSMDKHIIDITFESIDHIKCLITDEKLEDPNNISQNKALLEKISKYLPSQEHIVISAKVSEAPEEAGKSEVKSWYILLHTDEQIYKRGVNLVNIFADLANLGTFNIHRITALSNNEAEVWGIILISGSGINDIREVFMFIEDYCSFVLLKEGDIKNDEDVQQFAQSRELEKLAVVLAPAIPQPEVPVETPDLERSSLKRRTSMLVAEAARQSLKRISVDAGKLDYLMYLVSELITLNSKLLQTTKAEYYENIRPQIEQMEGLTKLFRSNALEIRLVPLGDMVIRFQRLVRDLGKQLGKKIELVTQGTDTELDKNTIDLISEPIIHIIRNCVDHGIELPDERLRKGKPETGTINLSAHQVGNFIHIRIEDDGAGLDLEKIQTKALEKGLIKADDKLTKQEICNLIFHSGISTAKNISNVSGRGVGMDVVKRKIAELRGDIVIDTENGKGTSFLLKIQQSIAIIDTLLFRVQNTYFILPLTDIEICVHTEKAKLVERQNTGTIQFNDKLIPFLDIRNFFELGGSYPKTVKTLILKEGGQYIGLLSDEILGEQQAVLKPLGQSFENETGITAVSQHGNGEWAYMLNTHYLHQSLRTMSTRNIYNNVIA